MINVTPPNFDITPNVNINNNTQQKEEEVIMDAEVKHEEVNQEVKVENAGKQTVVDIDPEFIHNSVTIPCGTKGSAWEMKRFIENLGYNVMTDRSDETKVIAIAVKQKDMAAIEKHYAFLGIGEKCVAVVNGLTGIISTTGKFAVYNFATPVAQGAIKIAGNVGEIAVTAAGKIAATTATTLMSTSKNVINNLRDDEDMRTCCTQAKEGWRTAKTWLGFYSESNARKITIG